ncbi:MAG: GNAT family N-acetyltransferase [Candidatus Moranbacteria bacterium]|nr:GNAT family N-acetyltransferase [Candidatus Moranbacteria bacterium]
MKETPAPYVQNTPEKRRAPEPFGDSSVTEKESLDFDEALVNIDQWVKELCRNQYPNFSARPVFEKSDHPMSAWENAIEWAVGVETKRSPEERSARRYREEYRLGMARAIESIIEFIEELPDTDSRRVRHFCHAVYEELFSYSPSIIEYVDIADAIHLSAKSSRNQFVREYISPNLIGENVYELAFMDTGTTDHIVERLSSLPTEELVDVIRQMPTLLAATQAQGDWAEPAFRNIAVILESLRESVTKPIVGYAIDISAERMREEIRNPSRGLLVMHGDPSFGRMDEKLDSEKSEMSERLSGRIDPDTTIPYDLRMQRIAADAVAMLDNSLTPQHIARLDRETLDEITATPLSPKIPRLRHLLESLSEAESIDDIRPETLIAFVTERLRDTEPDESGPASFLSDISDTVSEREWAAYFDAEDFMEKIRDIAQTEYQRIHGELYAVLDDTETAMIRKTVDKLRESLRKPASVETDAGTRESVGSIISPLLDDIENSLDSDAPTQSAGRLLSGLIGFLREHALFPELVSEYGQDFLGMTEERQILLDRYSSEEEASRQRILREHENELTTHSDAIHRVITTLRDGWTEFRDDLSAFAEAELERLRENDPSTTAHPIRYRNLSDIPDIAPYSSGEERPLLLQRLHEPAMLSHIGNDLGIDLLRLPIRAQIHLLTYVGDQEDSGFRRIRNGLKRHTPIADDLAYSFLATAESPEYGETILSLAERLDTETLGPILRKYAEITKDADAVSEYIRESFPNLEPEGVERETLAISKNLLRRGRDLLVEFSKQSDTDPETLLRKLDEARTDVILYKTAFRTLHESGSKEDLAEMMRSEIVSLQGTELGEDEQNDLLSIYGRNYPESEQYPAEFREKIFDGLRSAFRNPDSRFYLLRREGKIIGFRRFDAKGETEGGKSRKYAGSFNVDSAYRDAKIGEVFYQVTLEREGADSVIEAYVDPEAPVSSFYVERYGYGIDGVTEISGKPFLQMRRDLEANGAFITRSSDFDELVPDITEHMEEINERLSSVSVHTVDRSELFDLVRAKTKEGWTLTRLPYGEGGRDGGKVIAVFENPSLRKRVANATVKETMSEAA